MPKLVLRSSMIINAPVDVVFSCVSDAETYGSAVPCVVGLEFLTPNQRRGVGTRFKETRKYGRFRSSVEMECTSFVENHHIRLVRDAGKDVWDYLIMVEGRDGGTSTFMVCEARAYSPLSKLFTCLFGKYIRRELKEDIANVKKYCEAEMEAKKLQRQQQGHIAWNRGDDMTTLHLVPMRLSAMKGRDKSLGSVTSGTTASSREKSPEGQAQPSPAAGMTGRSSFTPAAA